MASSSWWPSGMQELFDMAWEHGKSLLSGEPGPSVTWAGGGFTGGGGGQFGGGGATGQCTTPPAGTVDYWCGPDPVDFRPDGTAVILKSKVPTSPALAPAQVTYKGSTSGGNGSGGSTGNEGGTGTQYSCKETTDPSTGKTVTVCDSVRVSGGEIRVTGGAISIDNWGTIPNEAGVDDPDRLVTNPQLGVADSVLSDHNPWFMPTELMEKAQCSGFKWDMTAFRNHRINAADLTIDPCTPMLSVAGIVQPIFRFVFVLASGLIMMDT